MKWCAIMILLKIEMKLAERVSNETSRPDRPCRTLICHISLSFAAKMSIDNAFTNSCDRKFQMLTLLLEKSLIINCCYRLVWSVFFIVSTGYRGLRGSVNSRYLLGDSPQNPKSPSEKQPKHKKRWKMHQIHPSGMRSPPPPENLESILKRTSI